MLGLFLASIALSASLVGMSVLPGEAELDIPGAGPLRSLRFWILSLLGFGLAGMPLTLLALEPVVAVLIASCTGVVLGRAMWPLFEEASSDTTLEGLEGAEGRALLTVGPSSGRIVIQTLASRIELPARTSDGSKIPIGRPVLVAFVEEGVAKVIAL